MYILLLQVISETLLQFDTYLMEKIICLCIATSLQLITSVNNNIYPKDGGLQFGILHSHLLCS
jgi:hypothetical protein